MTLKYNETAVQATEYKRYNSFMLSHPNRGSPRMHFLEEKIIYVDQDTEFSSGGSNLFVEDGVNTFPVLDPETGSATGESITLEQLRSYITSLYVFCAANRDLKEEN